MTCTTLNLPKLLHQLEQDEGCVHEVYLDHLGYPTFGIGHLIDDDEPEYWLEVGTKVSPERVQEAFEQDVKETLKQCAALYKKDWDDFPGEVKSILANMLFNLGYGNLQKFRRMNAALHMHNWTKAAVEGRDSRWYKQVTNRAERLMRRLELLDE
jgi:lysozyme